MNKKIITICGSTKFRKEILKQAKELTLKGWIVLMPNCFGHVDNDPRIEENKEMLDKLHKIKIDLSDAVLIINKEGYIGESTKREIEYAFNNKKEVLFLEL